MVELFTRLYIVYARATNLTKENFLKTRLAFCFATGKTEEELFANKFLWKIVKRKWRWRGLGDELNV